jgi:hypothetical protein
MLCPEVDELGAAVACMESGQKGWKEIIVNTAEVRLRTRKIETNGVNQRQKHMENCGSNSKRKN